LEEEKEEARKTTVLGRWASGMVDIAFVFCSEKSNISTLEDFRKDNRRKSKETLLSNTKMQLCNALAEAEIEYEEKRLDSITVINLAPLLFSSLIMSFQFMKIPQETIETGGFQFLDLIRGIGSTSQKTIQMKSIQ